MYTTGLKGILAVTDCQKEVIRTCREGVFNCRGRQIKVRSLRSATRHTGSETRRTGFSIYIQLLSRRERCRSRYKLSAPTYSNWRKQKQKDLLKHLLERKRDNRKVFLGVQLLQCHRKRPITKNFSVVHASRHCVLREQYPSRE